MNTECLFTPGSNETGSWFALGIIILIRYVVDNDSTRSGAVASETSLLQLPSRARPWSGPLDVQAE